MSDEAAASLFTLEIDRDHDVAKVRCRGKLVAGVTDVLYAEVSPLIPGTKRIVLDLTDLTYMDSMGLGTIVRLYVSARSAGCELKLVNLGKRIQQLLGISKLLSVLATVDDYGVPIH